MLLTRPAIFRPIGRATFVAGAVLTAAGWLLIWTTQDAGSALVYFGWIGLMAGYVLAPSGRVALFVLGALTWNLYFVGVPILVGLAAERGWRLLQRRRAPVADAAPPGESGGPGDPGESDDPGN
jgi:hypothetical protein